MKPTSRVVDDPMMDDEDSNDVKLNITTGSMAIQFEDDSLDDFTQQVVDEDEYLEEDDGLDDDQKVSSTNEQPPRVARNQCHICLSQFPLEKTYVEHMYNVHGVQRPFRCQDCGKCLSYRSSLYNHRKIHSNKRPWACQWCSAKFIWSNSLKYHVQRAHQQEFQRDPSLAGLRSRRLQAFHVTKNTEGDRSIVAADAVNVGPQARTLSKPRQASMTTRRATGKLPQKRDLESSGEEEEDSFCMSVDAVAASHTTKPMTTTTNPVIEKKRKKLSATARSCPLCSKRFFVDSALEIHLESCLAKSVRAANKEEKGSNGNQNDNEIGPSSSPRCSSSTMGANSFAKNPTAATELLAMLHQHAVDRNKPADSAAEKLSNGHNNNNSSNNNSNNNIKQEEEQNGHGAGDSDQVHALSVSARLDLLHARQETLIRRVESLEHNMTERIGKIEQVLVAAFAQQLMQPNT